MNLIKLHSGKRPILLNTDMITHLIPGENVSGTTIYFIGSSDNFVFVDEQLQDIFTPAPTAAPGKLEVVPSESN